MDTAVGVDGCRDGWVAVVLRGATVLAVELHAEFAPILRRHDAAPIGVDMPIGLPVDAPRRADAAARELLGRRASSVFTVAPRRALTASDHAAGSRISKRRIGTGISIQGWNLRDKILELDRLELPGRVHEVHPEVCFHVLAAELTPDEPLRSKATWRGLRQRLLLLGELGIDLLRAPPGPGGRIAPDDVVDAAVVAWTAAGAPTGELQRLPERADGVGVISFRRPA